MTDPRETVRPYLTYIDKDEYNGWCHDRFDLLDRSPEPEDEVVYFNPLEKEIWEIQLAF